MSNPGSPSILGGATNKKDKKDSKKDNGNGGSVAPHLDPVVRLNPLDMSGVQLSSSIKTKSPTTSDESTGKSNNKKEDTDKVTDHENMDTSEAPSNGKDAQKEASVSKPRRPSVHFAEPAVTSVSVVEAEVKPKASTTAVERSNQENRKHRSRKEKLVCRRYLCYVLVQTGIGFEYLY